MRIAKPLPVRWRSENSRIGELKILLGDWDPERTAFLECQSVPDELDAGRVLLRLLIDHAAKDVFGIEAENTDIYGGKLNKEGYKSVAKQLADRFGFEKVAITLRTSLSASDNDWAGMLYDGENYCFSKEYHLHIVDRVGGGDSFGGGLIYALLNGKDSQSAIEFAVAASALKHSIEGDFNRVTVAEVEKLAGGDGSGRVQR